MLKVILFAKHLLRFGLILLVTVSPTDMLNAQPNNSNSSNSESLIAIAYKLGRLNVLEKTIYQEIMQALKRDEISSRSALLDRLAQAARKRYLGPDADELGVEISLVVADDLDDDYKDEIRANQRNQLQQLLNQLKESGLLSDRVHQQLQAEIASGLIELDLYLYQQAAEQMQRYESLHPAQIEPLLNSLLQSRVISQTGYTQLLQELEAEKIEDTIEFLNYFDRTLIFNLRDYSRDPNDYFPKIYQAIAQMLSETGVADITLEDFTLQFIKNEYGSQEAVVSVGVNGRQYQQASYYSNIEPENENYFYIDSDGLINLFNKILRDRGSPYRLYTETVLAYNLRGVPVGDNSRFGILALTEDQAKQFYSGQEDIISHDDGNLTSDHIEELLTLFEQIGLFSHLTIEEIADGRKKIMQSYITDPNELLRAFEDVVVEFDWETGNIENPYQDLTYRFAAASRGAFAPTAVSNEFDWDKQIAGLFFTVNGTLYSRKLEFNDDWLDYEFLNLIEQAIKETVPDGRIYYLIDAGQYAGYIFLTDKQQRILKSAGIQVPFVPQIDLDEQS